MADSDLEFFIYNHDERKFEYFEGDRSKLEDIMAAENPEQISKELNEENINGILVLDEGAGRWYLGFSDSLGIVGQRTGRRQADSIVRSGYQLPDGYWLKGDYPMEELSDSNIGDLWQSVQQKYVKSTLSGMDIDEETGMPSQLAERAKDLENEGVSDELADSQSPKSKKSTPKPKAKPKKSKPKTKPKKSKPKAKSEKPKPKPKPKSNPQSQSESEGIPETPGSSSLKSTSVSSKSSKTSQSKMGSKDKPMQFLEVEKISNYVSDGKTRIVAKGNLTKGTEKAETTSMVLDQDKLSQTEWDDIAVFLEEGDVVQLSYETVKGQNFATSIDI